ncbi:Crp/Fnr family transcriptional regulator [Oscillatoria sp. CS-180]|uniref:Crp/Fnr family transcriptional regulator n=1 Tax=Oscillatoria sp. CS-180 TaxID=3021720 RepID=UPI00232AF0D9|nr:Crp/Fnr family transcriptional regulator [Oscillatoria sp. CS-180]MDB9527038.1 Crp/Fnr family transcriptional regulator [Oscillatoria sp. CS-180]
MASQIDVNQLQEISLFADLNESLLRYLSQQSHLRSYLTDEVIFYEGDLLPARLHVLVSGRLRMSKIAVSGKETILRILPAGEMFAAPALFGNGIAPATVVAIAPATVLTLNRQVLLESFAQAPELALHLLTVLNQRLQQLHQRVHGLVSQRAITRLVNYLESVADYGGTDPVANGEQLRSRLTYYQIARSIGITYEECVRLFRQLKPAAIYRRGGLITICDRAQLRSLCSDR